MVEFAFHIEKHPCRKDELFSVNDYRDFQIGYSILNNIPGFLSINNTPLDYMHLIYLGVVKKNNSSLDKRSTSCTLKYQIH